MELQEYLDGGNLEEAISAGIAAVKAHPTDTNRRYQLFAVLCFAGELHRARKQLAALDVGDPEVARSLGIYVNLLASEQERLAVFHHGARPLLPPEVPLHLELRLQALGAAAAKDHAAAADLLAAAVAAQPELTGSINGEPLAALRDMDDLLGSQLEVFAGGRYLWLPFERITDITIAAPSHLLDLLWLPATISDRHGSSSPVHLPVLYESSFLGGNPQTATGRATDWYGEDEGICRGRGQRLLGWAPASGEPAELPLLELRSLQLVTEG
jgi:type VI secretion system protein ImpE